MHSRKPRKPGHGWEFIVTVNGTKRSRTFKDRKSGTIWAREMEVNAERGNVGLSQNVTVATAFQTFIKDKPELTPRTVKLYGSFWHKHLGPTFGPRLLGSLRSTELQPWV